MQNQKSIPTRVVVHTKDIENITGLKDRTVRTLLHNIRKACGKKKHQFITVYEFCEFTGLSEKLVMAYLKD